MDIENRPTTKKNIKTKFLDSQYFEFIKGYKDFKGKTGRKKYWFFTLINIIITIILSFFWNPLAIVFQILIFLPGLALSVRRFHDIDKNPWYLLVPGYNLVLLLKETVINEDTDEYTLASKEINLKVEVFLVLSFLLLILSIIKFTYIQQQAKNNPKPKESVLIVNNKKDEEIDIEELNKLSLQEVEQAKTLEEVIQAYKNARTGSQASIKGAIKWVEFCLTSQQIKEASSNFPENSEASIVALEKWKKLSQREFALAQTIEEIKKVYENAPDDNDIKKMIYDKWNELSLEKAGQLQTVSEAKEAYDNSPKSSQSIAKILEKWKELTRQGIEQAQKFDDIKIIYENLPDDDSLKEETLTKWISLCQNTDEIKKVSLYTTDRENQRLALTKWKELAKQEIDQAQEFPDMSYLYGNLPDDNKIISSAILKWISLCIFYQDAKEVYSNIPSDYGEEKQIAFDKWNDLALKEIEQAQTLEAVKEIYNNTPENSSSREAAYKKIKELS